MISNRNFLFLFLSLSSIFFNPPSYGNQREVLENECISGVIKGKVLEERVVSPRGLVKTCRFLANYWVKNGEGPPDSIVPTYSQVKVEQMREHFYGEW